MDTPSDVESLRAHLKAMGRKEFLRLCGEAGVSASTMDKFRRHIVTEPGVFKVQALLRVLAEQQPKRQKAKAA